MPVGLQLSSVLAGEDLVCLRLNEAWIGEYIDWIA
jgi:hypothetical protein